MEMMDKVKAVQDYLEQTTGSDGYHAHWTKRVQFTDGVLFVAETCGAHWLVDVVASWQTRRKVAMEPFQVWTLSMAPNGDYRVHATEGNDNDLAVQNIGYSDFPKELLPFRLYLEGGVLLLPEER